jgi:hypothetical protein
MNSASVNSIINKSASLKSELLSQENNLQNQVSAMSQVVDSNNGGNMFSSILFWVGIAVLLIFLGFNVFTYLGDAGEFLKKLFAPILSFFGFAAGETAKQTIKKSAQGSQGIIGDIAGAATSGINLLQGNLTNPTNKASDNTSDEQENEQSSAPPSASPTNPSGPTESIELNNSKSGKAGYCFIGSENGNRSCVSITAKDVCISGDIFPTQDICINPTLRE